MPESSPAGPRYVRPPGLTGPWISQETRSLCFCGVFLLTENIPVDLFGSDPKPIMVFIMQAGIWRNPGDGNCSRCGVGHQSFSASPLFRVWRCTHCAVRMCGSCYIPHIYHIGELDLSSKVTGRSCTFVVLLCFCCFCTTCVFLLAVRSCCLCYVWFLFLSVGLSHRPVCFFWVQEGRTRTLETWFGGRVPPVDHVAVCLIAEFLTTSDPEA